MSNKNQINQIFSYLGKNNEVPAEKITQIYSAVYGDKVQSLGCKNITRAQFQNKLEEAMKQNNLDEELLWLFYHLDKDKKGYLCPEDVMEMFKIVDKKIALSDIQNSFKYAKIYKNKMTFQDFKEYFHNF